MKSDKFSKHSLIFTGVKDCIDQHKSSDIAHPDFESLLQPWSSYYIIQELLSNLDMKMASTKDSLNSRIFSVFS